MSGPKFRESRAKQGSFSEFMKLVPWSPGCYTGDRNSNPPSQKRLEVPKRPCVRTALFHPNKQCFWTLAVHGPGSGGQSHPEPVTPGPAGGLGLHCVGTTASQTWQSACSRGTGQTRSTVPPKPMKTAEERDVPPWFLFPPPGASISPKAKEER